MEDNNKKKPILELIEDLNFKDLNKNYDISEIIDCLVGTYDKLKDLNDLYTNQGKELNSVKNELRKIQGDYIVSNDFLTELKKEFEEVKKEMDILRNDLEHASHMEEKLTNIIERFIDR